MAASNHKLSKLQGLIATEDGEILHTGIVTVQARRHKFSEDYMSFFLGGFDELAMMTRPRADQDGKPMIKLGAEALGVLFHCLSKLNTKNEVDIRTNAQIASALGIKDSAVSRAVKMLCAAGIFTREADGRIVLSPSFGWRGKVSEHKKAAANKLEKDLALSPDDKDKTAD